MERNNSLDCLRVLACFLVILLHVSSGYVLENIENYNFQFTIGNFYDSFSRVCVPIFVMLSGAFLLENIENKKFVFFYKKSIMKIGIPTLIWSLIYVVYTYGIGITRAIVKGKEFDYFIPIKNWILGEPFYHLWYLYMIFGLYLITPILIRLKEEIGEKIFLKIAIIILVISMGIDIYNPIFWMIQFTVYIGYFMLGVSLKKFYEDRILNPKISLVIFFISATSIFILTEYFVKNNIFNKTLYFYNYLSPFVISGSVFIFIAFLNLKIQNKIYKHLASHSFNIYLVHAGIFSVIGIIFELLNFKFNGVWYIPLMSIIIFGISYGVSLIIIKITSKNKKRDIQLSSKLKIN